MKILSTIFLFSLLAPIIFQIIYGNRSIKKAIKTKFRIVCLISIAAHVLLTFLGMLAMAESLKTPQKQYYCGMPIVGLLVISIFVFLVMLVIMGIQLYVKVSHKNKLD